MSQSLSRKFWLCIRILIQGRKVCKLLLWTICCVWTISRTHRKPTRNTILYVLNQVWWKSMFRDDITSHHTSAWSGNKKISGIKGVCSYSCSGIQLLTDTCTHIFISSWKLQGKLPLGYIKLSMCSIFGNFLCMVCL